MLKSALERRRVLLRFIALACAKQRQVRQCLRSGDVAVVVRITQRFDVRGQVRGHRAAVAKRREQWREIWPRFRQSLFSRVLAHPKYQQESPSLRCGEGG